MLTQFGQILVFIILSIVFIFAGIITSKILYPKKVTREKSSTYECGEFPIGDSWIRFNIRFYVIALVFIIFDVEVVFLFPWAVVFKDMGMIAFIEMFVFLIILFIGFIYLWVRGDLEWVRPNPIVPQLKNMIISKKEIADTGSKAETIMN